MRIWGLLAAALFVSPWGAVGAAGCDSLPLPSVTVNRFEERVTTNFEYGYRALTNIGAALAGSDRLVLGLTRGTAVVRAAFRAPGFIDRTGRYECVSPQLTVSYGFSPMTVYVAREFPAGTCAYRQIYDHELRHVRTYQAHVAAIEKEIAATLTERFATGAPWRGPVGQTENRLQKELDERWIPYVQREMNRVNAEQGQIDTPEEYERVRDSCNGEIKQRLTPRSAR
jgi:hypothetical protein